MTKPRKIYIDITLKGGTTASLAEEEIVAIQDESNGSILYMRGGHVFDALETRETIKSSGITRREDS